MSGKGSKRRPLGVNRAVFDSNWDNIFKNKKREESDKWEHKCKHNGVQWLNKGEACNWCGEAEDG